MRRTVVLVLAAVMLFTVVAPALAVECVCTPWCGKVRSQGYWKNDGISANNYWMNTDWQIKNPSAGDYKQIFMNQAIAFHNNYLWNPCCNGVAFQSTYVMGPCGSMKSMHEIDAAVHAMIDADFEGYSRSQVLMLKDVLDKINNNYGIVVCTAPTNGV